MAAGKLRELIVIRTPTASQSASGEVTNSWATLASVWADIEPATTRDLLAAQHVAPSAALKVTIRNRTDVTSKMRVQINGQDYEILGEPQDPNGQRRWTQILCQKVT